MLQSWWHLVQAKWWYKCQWWTTIRPHTPIRNSSNNHNHNNIPNNRKPPHLVSYSLYDHVTVYCPLTRTFYSYHQRIVRIIYRSLICSFGTCEKIKRVLSHPKCVFFWSWAATKLGPCTACKLCGILLSRRPRMRDSREREWCMRSTQLRVGMSIKAETTYCLFVFFVFQHSVSKPPSSFMLHPPAIIVLVFVLTALLAASAAPMDTNDCTSFMMDDSNDKIHPLVGFDRAHHVM